MRVWKDVFVARKPSNISYVRGQVEDIILGNRETQQLASDHLSHSPKQSDFNIRYLRGPMRGLKDVSVGMEARPTFPDVRGQVEDIILGNRETQN
ncbi:hypothetical protein TNIN_270441 [Trichonephila inaurata madagascariensis]|uniref:Uncharacterized protein n=1 Tax=Trichonephila inaurata madagascariensis TaxID=2747483 RepID=A0A8X7BYA7_9ARAC|nr:hypothetical protein TNIN_270441 [Trichonephila inaurata madagascariensis]